MPPVCFVNDAPGPYLTNLGPGLRRGDEHSALEVPQRIDVAQHAGILCGDQRHAVTAENRLRSLVAGQRRELGIEAGRESHGMAP